MALVRALHRWTPERYDARSLEDPKDFPLDGAREHVMADAEMARATLQRAFEDYFAWHLAVAGVTTFEQLPKEVVLMALLAWSETFTRLSVHPITLGRSSDVARRVE